MNHSRTFFDDIEFTLAKERTVLVFGPVCDEMLGALTVRLYYLRSQSHKPITIILNTQGGLVPSGLGLYDLILEIKKTCPVNILATASCLSMGLILLQAGTKRLATPHTTFLLHELSANLSGRASEMQDQQKQADRLQKQLDDIIEKRTGQDMKKLRQLFLRRDLYMNAAEALKHKVIDEIVG